MTGSRPIAVIAIIIAVLLVAGGVFFFTRDDDDPTDNGSGTATTTAAGTPTGVASTPGAETAQDALNAAAAQWDATNSAHFDLQIDGQAFIDDAQTLELRSASGDIARPDLVDATAQISVSLVVFEVGIIAIGDEMYQTNIVTGNWEQAPEDFDYNPAILFNETEGISAVVRKVQSPEFDGEETVDGRPARIVAGTLTGDDISEITAGALSGDVIDTRLWIADDTSDIVKVVLQAPATDGGTPTTWTLTITNQNDPVVIEAPEV